MTHAPGILRHLTVALFAGTSMFLMACHPVKRSADAGSTQTMNVTTTVVDTTFDVMPHMIAAVEMQLSGEPLAEAMGRVLSDYSRDDPVPNIYFQSTPTRGPWVDIVGFATAVESYEYSKQPMNNLNFESGAGEPLLFGPLINPSDATGMNALNLMAAATQHYADQSNLSGTLVSWNQTLPGEPPSPPNSAGQNVLGWPGFWPTLHPYARFDPTIAPTNAVDWSCSITSDDTPGLANAILNEDYECDYTTLQLPDRATQVQPLITPGSSGWAGWKSALWVMNYLQIMHDSANNSIASVPDDQLANVGTPGNTIVGVPSQPGTATAPGVYIGSSTIEGFQAAVMIAGLDNQAQDWLTNLTTTDGTTLSGFGSLLTALQYDYTAPLRWIPEEITVSEDATDASGFPRPTGETILSSDSSLLDLDGLLGAYASTYALTDTGNSGVGGSQPALIYFDGDPFPTQNQTPAGDPTLHDRSLAMMRFLVTTLDRVHRDPASGLLVDNVTFSGGMPTRGDTVATSSICYTLMALRNVRRALSSALQLYSNTTPDEVVTATPLDDFPFNGSPNGDTFTQRLNVLIQSQIDLLMNNLTTADGHAYDGWDVTTGALTDTNDTLDAHSAAIRGLLTAYLATGDVDYRTRALAVFQRMDSVFYFTPARIYTDVPPPVTTVPYTPMRFGMLEGSLRDMYELIGNAPGQSTLGALLEDRIGRLIKLVLNGWDDRNENDLVEWPQECTNVVDGIPRGGLQMAERALSGELGSLNVDIPSAFYGRIITTDREQDCVPDIAAAGLPSALANEVDFKLVTP